MTEEKTTASERFAKASLIAMFALIALTLGSFVVLTISVIWQGHWVYGPANANVCLEERTGLHHQCYSTNHENHGTYWARAQELLWKTATTAFILALVALVVAGITFLWRDLQ